MLIRRQLGYRICREQNDITQAHIVNAGSNVGYSFKRQAISRGYTDTHYKCNVRRKNISGTEHLSQLTGSSPAHKVCREDVEPTQHLEAADGDRVEEEDTKKMVNKKTSTVMTKMEVMTIMVMMMMMMMRRIMVIIKRTEEMMTMRVMAIVRRMLEIMTMRVMVIIMRMADRFVANCPGNLAITQVDVVNTGTYADPRSLNWETQRTKSRGRRDYNLWQYCPQRCHLLAARLETLVRSGHFGANPVGSKPQQRSA
jgi:hypothetical protein